MISRCILKVGTVLPPLLIEGKFLELECSAVCMNSEEVRLGNEKEVWEENLGEVRVSSEPCKPTTSACGRPTHFVRRKRKEDIRSAVVPVRFTEAEHATVKGFAEARRLSLSDFIRTMVLGRKLPHAAPPEVSRRVYHELGRIGNNLNRLVRSVNGGLATVVDHVLLHELSFEVRRLGQMLIQGRA